MTMVIFLIGSCLGAIVVFVGLSVLISLLAHSSTKKPRTNPQQTYDDIIAHFSQESEQSLTAFCERLNQVKQKGNHS